jgi:hypothetical protein
VDVDELYGLPMERFVPERGALARELRKAGQREEAAEIAALRKPSVAAWAVNQLVQTQRKAITELLEAGDALRGAHDEVLAGRGDGGSLRAAVERERTAVDALTSAARGLLTSEGHELSATIIDRVADTLHAAALDDDARSQVREGRLERELRHVGLGLATPATPAPARRAGKKPSATKEPGSGKAGATERATGPDRAAAREQAAAQRAAAERAARERAEARAAARAAEREARRLVERAARASKLAHERRDRAAEALSEVEAELELAERELGEAEIRLRDVQKALRDLLG